MIDPNALEEWKGHPITQSLFERLKELEKAWGHDLVRGCLSGDPSCIESYNRIVGRGDIVEVITSMSIFKEDSEDDM